MFRFPIPALMLSAALCSAAEAPKSAPAEQVDTIRIEKLPDEAAAPKKDYDKALRDGVNFLLKEQKEDGSWGDHRVIGTWNITCPYPDGPLTFKNASTALCILGLNATPMRDEAAVQKAMERAEDYLIKSMPKLKRGDSLCVYNPWAHTYVLDALSMRAATMDKNSPRYKKLKACAEEQIQMLTLHASGKGGWGYLTYSGYSVRPASEPTSFMTATVLISLKLAQDSFGLNADKKHFSRAQKFLKSTRTPAGTYVYSLSHCYYPGRPINRHTGSLARTPAGDYALKIWDDKAVSATQLEDGLDRLWSRRGWLTMALHKPKPHESFAQNSGYFFYYGYYYTAMCLDMMPQERVKRHAAFLGNDIVRRQCDDGSWWDNPLYNYHKFYGTGYALYALSKSFDKLYAQPAATVKNK